MSGMAGPGEDPRQEDRTKKPYDAPELTEYGSALDLTNSTGATATADGSGSYLMGKTS